jgi:Fe-Mn family superoxide dismutase
MPFQLPDLPYPYDALEPHIDAETMRIHHDLHHKAYVDNANAALEGTEEANASLEHLLTILDTLPADKQGPAQQRRRPREPLAVLADHELRRRRPAEAATSPARSTRPSTGSTS